MNKKEVEKLIHVKELIALEPGKVYCLKMSVDNYEVGNLIDVIAEILKTIREKYNVYIQLLVECPGMKFEFLKPSEISDLMAQKGFLSSAAFEGIYRQTIADKLDTTSSIEVKEKLTIKERLCRFIKKFVPVSLRK
jgi:hypothetical protein